MSQAHRIPPISSLKKIAILRTAFPRDCVVSPIPTDHHIRQISTLQVTPSDSTGGINVEPNTITYKLLIYSYFIFLMRLFVFIVYLGSHRYLGSSNKEFIVCLVIRNYFVDIYCVEFEIFDYVI